MRARGKTYGEFAHDAARRILILICQMRIMLVENRAEMGETEREGLDLLEKDAGIHAPQRTDACGDCKGCGLVPARSVSALLH